MLGPVLQQFRWLTKALDFSRSGGVTAHTTSGVLVQAGRELRRADTSLLFALVYPIDVKYVFPLSRLIVCPYPHYIIYPQSDSPPSESRYIPRLPPLSIYDQDQKLPE
jgi:hypothetical protein